MSLAEWRRSCGFMDKSEFNRGVEIARGVVRSILQDGNTRVDVQVSRYETLSGKDRDKFLSDLVRHSELAQPEWDTLQRIAEQHPHDEPVPDPLAKWALDVVSERRKRPKPLRIKAYRGVWDSDKHYRDVAVVDAMGTLVLYEGWTASGHERNRDPSDPSTNRYAADAVAEAVVKETGKSMGYKNVERIWHECQRDDSQLNFIYRCVSSPFERARYLSLNSEKRNMT